MDLKKAFSALARVDWLWLLLAHAGLAILLYHRALEFGYVLDDVIVYTENSFVQKGFAGIRDILAHESFTGYFGEQKDLVAGARYRPLSIVSFAIEYELLGHNPMISHLVNILLYALTATMLYLWLSRLVPTAPGVRGLPGLAAMASLLFLAHPVHSEAVANIKGRDEIMCLLFSLCAAWGWLKFVDRRKPLHALFASTSFLLALFSKENAITFAAVIPLSVHFFRNQPLKKALVASWPLQLCALLFVLVRWKVIGYLLSSGAVITDLMNNPFVGMNTAEKTATVFYTFIWYYKLLIFPHPLTHDYYPYHVPRSEWTDLIPIAAFLLTAGLIYLAFRLRRRHPVMSYSLFYYFITFSIVSNLVFPVGTFMNERFLFMPSVAFSLVTALGIRTLGSWSPPKGPWLATTALLALMLPYGLKTLDRVPDWEDGFKLNLSAVKVSKNSARINLFTGVSYFQKYQAESDPNRKYESLKSAEQYIDRALKIFPQYGQALNMKSGVLAEWLKKDNDIHRFLKSLEEVIRVKPDLDFVTKYMEYLTRDADNNAIMIPFFKRVGYEVLYKEEHNYAFAIHFLGMAYKIDSQDAELCFYIAQAYSDFAKFGKAKPAKIAEYEQKSIDFYNQAASLDPRYAR